MIVLTALAYAKTLAHGFVDFDDQSNLVENPAFRGLAPSNLAWMFTDLHGHYIPLTWLSFAVDYRLWGLDARGYHLSNLLLHLANAALFYVVAMQLIRAARLGVTETATTIGAAAAAAFFAVHPLRVESVAWATERRDVLSGLFFLLTIRSYLRTHETASAGAKHASGARPFPVAALGWYVLSLLAKPVGMTVPLVLVVLDAYPLRRFRDLASAFDREHRDVWLEKVPFVLLGVCTAILEGIAESRVGTFYSIQEYGIGGRVGQAFYALAFYLAKTVLPIALSPLYVLPVGWRFWRADVLVSAVIVAAVSGTLLRFRRRWPWALAAWAAYVALLAPVLGIAQAGPHIAADRYTYLATLGFAVVYGGIVAVSLARPATTTSRMIVGSALPIVLALAALTWRQVDVWRDSVTLWQRAVRIDPQCYVCRNNLGNALVRAGRPDEAIAQFRAALDIQPADADAYANLGTVADGAGRADEARRYFEQALRIDPTQPVAHNNLARLLIAEGKSEEAIPHLETALRRDPMQGESYINLGLALLDRGDLDGAEHALHRAGEILPEAPAVPNDLGIIALRRDRPEAALAEFRRAAALDAGFAEARFNMALAFRALGRDAEAIEALRAAIRLRPDYVAAEATLAELLRSAGRVDEAAEHLDAALRAAPDGTVGVSMALTYMDESRSADAIAVLRQVQARHPEDLEAANMLAWLLATAPRAQLRDGAAAVTLAERAVAGSGDQPDADRLDTLAAAYAEVGRFGDAAATARRAEAAARSSGNQALAEEIAARITGYEQRRPFRSE